MVLPSISIDPAGNGDGTYNVYINMSNGTNLHIKNISADEIGNKIAKLINDAESTVTDRSHISDCSFDNKERFTQMIDVIDKYINSKPCIKTHLGKADPTKGYKIEEIRFWSNGAVADVLFLDRSARDNNEPRNGDIISLRIVSENNTYTVYKEN